MPSDVLTRAKAAIERARAIVPLGRVATVCGGIIRVAGLPLSVRLGDRLAIRHGYGRIGAEVVALVNHEVHAVADAAVEGISVGDAVELEGSFAFAPDTSWIGRIVDPDGLPLDGRPLLPGAKARSIRAAPPAAYARRGMGARIHTGYAVFDTLLPLVRGQRIGLMAGSGVGKSTLISGLARQLEADVVVIALVGERGREVRDFVEKTLGAEGLSRAVVVAATSDRAPQVRRRCAWAATAVAEHFRDLGLHVLLLVDSVTRFAEAHREIAVAGGEAAALRGFPASTGPAIAALCERAGPGQEAQGDITAIYSVLVAGSDMDEPVADMLRGVLDGHFVLDRAIAERGRFPAVDVLRSVSRSLPDAANEAENEMIAETRRLMSTYDRVEMMVQSGLYVAGADPEIDRAIATHSHLENLLSQRNVKEGQAFSNLRQVLRRR